MQIFPVPFKIKRSYLVVLILIPLVFLALLLTKLLEPSSPVLNLTLSNQTDHKVSISWVTQKPTKGEVLISKDKNFPGVSIFTPKHKDDGEDALRKSYLYTTHHVTLRDLEAKQNYYFRIYQGLKKVYEGSFTTGSVLGSLPAPDPVYGRIIGVDKKPLIGALVYLQVWDTKGKSSILSTLTNKAGRWSLDLGNLRTKSLDLMYSVSSSSSEKLIVSAGAKGRASAESTKNKDKPWPDIVLK